MPLLATLLLLLPAFAAAEELVLFKAIEPPKSEEQSTDWANLLAEVPGPDGEERARAIRALEAAERAPSMATAIGLLANFKAFSEHPEFREAAFAANLDVFLMADAAKYELVAQTSRKLNADNDGAIAASVRVGSSGGRYRAWLDWDGKGPMPIDDAYRNEKLFQSDDDVTHWTRTELRRANPVANELVNGGPAARAFQEVTSDYLAAYPKQYREGPVDPLNGRASVAPGAMKVEFLSPTEAQAIMGKPAERKAKGWDAPIDLSKKAHFLGAWILSDIEKYNGLYGAEQLHEWGLKKGVVTENVDDPRGSTVTYEQSVASGVMQDITGGDVFPEGVLDSFGWMANNYRQIFVVHDGDLESVAKYTLRMQDWWQNVGLSPTEAIDKTKDYRFLDTDIDGELADLQTLMKQIREPDSPEKKAQAISEYGDGPDGALKKLKQLNKRMLVAGHRKHFEVLASTAVAAMKDHAARNPAQPGRAPKEMTLEEVLDFAKRQGGAAPTSDDGPGALLDFNKSLEALANGYANLPEELSREMAQDLAWHINKEATSADPENHVRAAFKAGLLPALKEAVDVAKAAGAGLKAQAQAFGDLRLLLDSPIGKAVNAELAAMKQPDLDHYLLKLARGDLTIRRTVILSDAPDRWPGARVVDQQWTPADVATDLKRIASLASTLGWSNDYYAQRLANYFAGPDTGAEVDAAFADRAVKAYLALGRVFSPAAETTHTVTYKTGNGETRAVQLHGTRFWDSALTAGHLIFAESMKGGLKIWGVADDIKNAHHLVKTLESVLNPKPGTTPDQQAANVASVISDALSLQSYASMGAKAAGLTNVADALGDDAVLSKASNTFGVLAQYSNDPMNPDGHEALLQAALKDLLIWARPDIATALTIYGIYSYFDQWLVPAGAKSDLIELLVKNGTWEFPQNGKPPVLKSVHAFGRTIADDPAARAKQCKARLADQSRISGRADFKPIGLEVLLKLPSESYRTGTPICTGTLGKGCPQMSGVRVRPRADAITLFTYGGHHGKDVPLRATQDAVDNLIGWGGFADYFRRAFSTTTIGDVTRKELEGHGITVPTPEDASAFVREKIVVSDEAAGTRLVGGNWGSGRTEATRTWLQNRVSVGGRKLYGYLASQYWVRRQFLLECQIFDPIIAEAGRRAQEQRVAELEPTAFAEELAGLDERVKEIDRKIWPEIAASADPYEAEVKADDKLQIYADYRIYTERLRSAVRQIDDWFGTDGVEAIPWAAVRYEYGGTISRDEIEAATSEAEKLVLAERMLRERGRSLLRKALDVVHKYEDVYGGVLTTFKTSAKRIAEGDRFSVTPHHVHLFPPESYRSVGPKAAQPDTSGGNQEVDWDEMLLPEPEVGSAPSSGNDQGNFQDMTLLPYRMGEYPTFKTADSEAKAWKAAYDTAWSQALDDLAARMAVFQERLQPAWLDVLSPSEVAFNPLSGLLEYKAEDLALLHPLWPRLLRLKFQMVKLGRAGVDAEWADNAERMSDEELAALRSTVTFYKPDSDDAAGGGDKRGQLQALYDRSEARYKELLALAEQMFELKLASANDEWRLLTEQEVTAASEPLPDSGVTQEEIDAWAGRYIWEIVPATTEQLRDVEALTASLAEDSGLPQMAAADPDRGKDVLACEKSDRGRYFQRTFRTVDTRAEARVRYPLIKSGRFLLRLTVLSAKDVPLVQKQAFVVVNPGSLGGRIELEGDLNPEQYVRLGFSRSEALEEYQPVGISGAGPFEEPLCEFIGEEVIDESGAEAKLHSREKLDSSFVARSVGVPGVITPLVGKAIAAAYLGRGKFALRDTLVLSDSGLQSVKLEVRDAAGVELSPVRTVIRAGEEEAIDQAEAQFALKKNTPVSAEATFTLPASGREIKGRAPSILYDPERDAGGMVLAVEVPVYDTGNLYVSGNFKLSGAIEGVSGIAGGELNANVLGDAPASVSGAPFVISNNRPVALQDGFKMTALLRGDDPEQTLLAPKGEIERELQPGGKLDLGTIPVSAYATPPVDLRVSVIDWTGAPLPPDRLKVTLADEEMTATPDGYVGKLSFSKWLEQIAVKAVYTGPTGEAFESEVALRLDAVGDPFAPVAPEPIELRLKVYPPGRIQAVGIADLGSEEQPAEGAPVELKLSTPRLPSGDLWSETAGTPFRLDLSVDVTPGEMAQLAARPFTGPAGDAVIVEAAAPKAATSSGQVAEIDFGRLLIGDTSALVAVPDVVGRASEDAEDAVRAAGLEPSVTRGEPAESDAEAGFVYGQEPPPSTDDPATRVARGSVIALRAHPVFVVPDVRSASLADAEAKLGAAGFSAAPVRREPSTDPKVLPETVVAQSPAAGTRLAKPGRVEIHYHAAPTPPEPEPEETGEKDEEPIVTAEVEPVSDEPDEDNGPPDEGDDTADDEEDDGARPAAGDSDFTWAQAWKGRIQLVGLKATTPELSLSCSNFVSCADRWTDGTLDQLRATLEKERAEEARKANEERTIGEELAEAFDFGGAILDGLDTAILLGVTMAGVVGLDIAFDGVDVGFVLNETDGKLALALIGAGDEADKLLQLFEVVREGDSSLLIKLGELPPEANDIGAVIDMSARLVQSETDGEIKMTFKLSGKNRSSPGTFAMEASGTFVPGELPIQALSEGVVVRFTRMAEAAKKGGGPGRGIARVMEFKKDYEALMKEYGHDVEDDE